MLLHELRSPESQKKKSLRIGRGNGTGRGNYSTRGLKGHKARSGYSRKPGFEGGQTPLHMRLPKLRGFKRYFKLQKSVVVINLGRLQEDDRIKANDTLTPDYLSNLGYGKAHDQFKILGHGDLSKSLTIQGIAISAQAQQGIEKAGGSVNN